MIIGPTLIIILQPYAKAPFIPCIVAHQLSVIWTNLFIQIWGTQNEEFNQHFVMIKIFSNILTILGNKNYQNEEKPIDPLNTFPTRNLSHSLGSIHLSTFFDSFSLFLSHHCSWPTERDWYRRVYGLVWVTSGSFDFLNSLCHGFFWTFLDAPMHLYNYVCPFDGQSVRQFVRPSIPLSICNAIL